MNDNRYTLLPMFLAMSLAVVMLTTLRLGTLNAQQNTSSFILPIYLSDPNFDTDGMLHVVIKTEGDENGCVRYTITHNFQNLRFTPNNTSPFDASMIQRDDFTVTICDEQQCMITGALRGVWKFQSTSASYFYSLWFTWNRCTGEWTFLRLDFEHQR